MKPITSGRYFQSPRFHSTTGKIRGTRGHYGRIFNAAHLGSDETGKHALDANTKGLILQRQILAEFVDECLDDWWGKKDLKHLFARTLSQGRVKPLCWNKETWAELGQQLNRRPRSGWIPSYARPSGPEPWCTCVSPKRRCSWRHVGRNLTSLESALFHNDKAH